MNLFDVYPLYDVTPVKAEDCYVYDDKNIKYLDLYGGHGVISIGHSHPNYIAKLKKQLAEQDKKHRKADKNLIGFVETASLIFDDFLDTY